MPTIRVERSETAWRRITLRSFPRKRESSCLSKHWIPACAGMNGDCCPFARLSYPLVKQPRLRRASTGQAFSQRSARRACPVRAKASVIALFLCGAGYAVVPLRSPRQSEGGGAPSDATLSSLVAALPLENAAAPLGAPPRQAFEASPGLFADVLPSGVGPRFSVDDRLVVRLASSTGGPCGSRAGESLKTGQTGPPSASSWQAPLVAAGRSP